MTKKKSKKSIKEHILTPVSFRRAMVFSALFVTLSGLNLYSVITSPAASESNQTVVSQAELMDALGKTLKLGDVNKEDYAPFYNKPEVKYWYELIQNKPQFRDAHIILATLAYNDHNCQIAQSHVSTAITIDPTYKHINQLKEFIDYCQK